MLATIRDDTWTVLNMQHKTPNLKSLDYLDIPGGGHNRTTGPTHMAEGGHHPTPTHNRGYKRIHKLIKQKRGSRRPYRSPMKASMGEISNVRQVTIYSMQLRLGGAPACSFCDVNICYAKKVVRRLQYATGNTATKIVDISHKVTFLEKNTKTGINTLRRVTIRWVNLLPQNVLASFWHI